MRILMSATTAPEAAQIADRLSAAGHQVVRCHEPADRGLLCSALQGRACPIDDQVDLAVAVRERPTPYRELLEDGVVCAIRSHIPLVVTGVTAANPYRQWSTEIEGELTPETAQAVVGAPLRGLSQSATEALRSWLAATSRPGSGEDRVAVRRVAGGLQAQVFAPGLDGPGREVAAVRVHQSIRAADRTARAVDVTFAGD
ncbi:MAG TPA: hypothetical protein VFA11_02500 [Acidimicrobiales bacterium]|nr:hypothetical protein [Acidimicrobiales bacterium]